MPVVLPWHLDQEFMSSPVMQALDRLYKKGCINDAEAKVFLRMPFPIFETRIKRQVATATDLDLYLLRFIRETCTPQITPAANDKKKRKRTAG